MAKKDTSQEMQMTPEFQEWLKNKNVKGSFLRKNPDIMQSYYQEWLQVTKKSRKKRRSFLTLPNIDLQQIGNNLLMANEILSTVQSVKNMMANSKKQ